MLTVKGPIPIAIRSHLNDRKDDAAAGMVDASIFPELPHRTATDVRHKLVQRERAEFHRAFLVDVGNRTVGRLVMSSSWWHNRVNPIHLSLSVLEEYRAQGVGRALWSRVAADLAAHPCTDVSVMVRDDDARSSSVAQRVGLIRQMTLIHSKLDLEASVQQVAKDTHWELVKRGYSFLDGEAAIRRFPDDWRHRWWRVHTAVAQDIPSVDPHVDLPFETFERVLLKAPGFRPANWSIAIHNDQWIGLTGLRPLGHGTASFAVCLTGVCRAHRRLGVATALKTVSALQAKARGGLEIFTDNEQNNPMWSLNQVLGFTRMFAVSSYRGPKPKVVTKT